MSGSFAGFVFSFGLSMVFLVFFVKGYPWARVVLAVFQFWGFFGNLYDVTVSAGDIFQIWYLLLPYVLLLAAEATACYFLAFDKGVSAYQYEKRTGGDRYL